MFTPLAILLKWSSIGKGLNGTETNCRAARISDEVLRP